MRALEVNVFNRITERLGSFFTRIREVYPRAVEGRVFGYSGPVLKRDLAEIAGIGWIGKNIYLSLPGMAPGEGALSPREGLYAPELAPLLFLSEALLFPFRLS
ncbi:MAG: hypothetical protein ACE5I0_02795 [Candidatus Binatia bacterium]